MSGIRSIVVAGNGLGAALAAAVLAARLGAAYRVTIVPGGDDPHGLGPVGTAISTRPGFARFLIGQGLAPDGVLAATDGAFTLGAAFSGWRGDAHGWMLPYGDIGAPIGPVAFHQLLHRLRAEGGAAVLADHAIAAVAAQADRFAPPSDDPASPLWAIDHGLSFDIDLLATLFVRLAVARGVTVADRPIQAFDRATGRLRLADGSIVAGDFFLDLTGAQALLSADHGWHDWRPWFPFDRALTAMARDPHPPLPFTHGGATATGWRLSVPVDGGRGDVLFYSSAHRSADAAAQDLALPVRHAMPVAAGRRARFWHGSVVAMGAAAAGIDPLHPVALTQLTAALDRLLALFPDRADEPVLAKEYDRRTAGETERIRDFALLHHALSDRPDPVWRAVRGQALPDGAAWKLDQYRSRGRISLYDDETFERDEWVALFDGLDVRADRRDALADLIPADQFQRHFTTLRQRIVAAVRTMPSHQAALAALRQRIFQ